MRRHQAEDCGTAPAAGLPESIPRRRPAVAASLRPLLSGRRQTHPATLLQPGARHYCPSRSPVARRSRNQITTPHRRKSSASGPMSWGRRRTTATPVTARKMRSGSPCGYIVGVMDNRQLYPTDITDAEWNSLGPLLAAPTLGEGHVSTRCARSLIAFSMGCIAPSVSGGTHLQLRREG
jgi:hypothetical protein